MSKPTSISDQMLQIAAYAVKVAADTFNRTLDYSENSLDTLEGLLRQACEQNNSQLGVKYPSEVAIQKTARVWGSYLGEVIRRKWGGEWIDENSKRLVLINGIPFSPVSYSYGRITGQNENNLKLFLDEIAIKLSSQLTNPVQPKSNPPDNIFPNYQSKEAAMTDSILEIRNSKEPPIRTKSYVGILVTIAVFLALILAVAIYQVVTSYQQTKLAEERASAYQTRVAAAQLLVANQQDIISGLMTNYQKDAYGSSVDRIAEQQLIASEYNLTALQIIALQNSQIIELLSTAP